MRIEKYKTSFFSMFSMKFLIEVLFFVIETINFPVLYWKKFVGIELFHIP